VSPALVNARRGLRWLWAMLLATSGCLWWTKRQLSASGAVIVFTLHRVLDEAGYLRTQSLPGIVIKDRTFREFVAYVVRRYEPVDFRQVRPGKPSDKVRVAFTFDDGWSDNYSIALPIARKHEIPLTIFICPGLLDRDRPFWPEEVAALIRAIRPAVEVSEIEAEIETLKTYAQEARTQYLARLSEEARHRGICIGPSDIDRTVSWAAIAEMDREGVNFGSHTQTHQILTKVSPEEARKEVQISKAAIERALSKRCDTFAYPNGNWSVETQQLLAEEGIKLAVTSERGAWTAHCDLLAIPRSNISEDNVVGPRGRFSPTMFEYTTFWKSWRETKAKSRLAFRPSQEPTPAAL